MSTIAFDQEFFIARDTPSDINEHMELLKSLADEVNHVTEMGTRTGVSTRAFLASDVTLRAYDLFLDDQVQQLFNLAKEEGKDAEYIQANVLEIEIDETDLLFIDTWHCYDQLIAELKLHASKVKKYIAFHDTQTYGTRSEEFMGRVGSNGLLPAIIHYMIENPNDWRFKIHRTNNNGLSVLERIK
jgi:cephalosporin hydroxylase